MEAGSRDSYVDAKELAVIEKGLLKRFIEKHLLVVTALILIIPQDQFYLKYMISC